jgi:uncharacterized protein DUF6069
MQTPPEANTKFAPSSLGVATALTAAGSVVAVVVVRAITLNLVTVPTAFTPLSKASTAITLSILGVLAASASCLLLNRLSDRPVETFRRVAPIALAVSFVPDIAIWAAHSFHHSAKASTVLPLMIMHVLVATLCLTLLPRLGSARPTVRAVPVISG